MERVRAELDLKDENNIIAHCFLQRKPIRLMSSCASLYAVVEVIGMQITELKIELPEALVRDFASDPLAPFDNLLRKSNDSAWPLYPEITRCLASLPAEAIQAAYADRTFLGLYGQNERLARIWMAERFLIEEVARRRLEVLAAPFTMSAMPYAADCLRDVKVDDEGMVHLADFTYNTATLGKNGYCFIVSSTTESPNSTYWLLRSFYELGLANDISVRLDPFLWGSSDSFPQTMYKMIVYAKPIDWDGIGRLTEQHHGQMRADEPADKSEVTEFIWDRRDDGIHFTCEELPPRERIHYAAARYLHAIYNPRNQAITHLDGALRIYSAQQLEQRKVQHLRKSGKAGVRRKIFRLDQPIGRDAFSLIAQAFFVWNSDLKTYFSETLSG